MKIIKFPKTTENHCGRSIKESNFLRIGQKQKLTSLLCPFASGLALRDLSSGEADRDGDLDLVLDLLRLILFESSLSDLDFLLDGDPLLEREPDLERLKPNPVWKHAKL